MRDASQGPRAGPGVSLGADGFEAAAHLGLSLALQVPDPDGALGGVAHHGRAAPEAPDKGQGLVGNRRWRHLDVFSTTVQAGADIACITHAQRNYTFDGLLCMQASVAQLLSARCTLRSSLASARRRNSPPICKAI